MSRIDLMDRHGRQVLAAVAAGDMKAAHAAAKQLWYVGFGSSVAHSVDGYMVVSDVDGFKSWRIGA